jgi:hypothetical protein
MKTILKDYIGYFETPNPTGQISYLEPEITSKPNHWGNSQGSEMGSNGFSSYPEIGLALKSLFIQAENHRVSSTMDPEMTKDIQSLHGIDMSTMIKSTLENEMEMMIEKKILEAMEREADRNWKLEWTKFQTIANKWFGYEPKMTWNSIGDITRHISLLGEKMKAGSRVGGGTFVIVNSRIGAEIQNSQEFIYNDDLSRGINNSSGIYPAGNLFGVKVLVNPRWPFCDDKILVGLRPPSKTTSRIFMVENPEEESESITTATDSFQTEVRNVLTRKFGIKTVPSSNYITLKTAGRGKRHNLFTHLLSKYFNHRSRKQ